MAVAVRNDVMHLNTVSTATQTALMPVPSARRSVLGVPFSYIRGHFPSTPHVRAFAAQGSRFMRPATFITTRCAIIAKPYGYRFVAYYTRAGNAMLCAPSARCVARHRAVLSVKSVRGYIEVRATSDTLLRRSVTGTISRQPRFTCIPCYMRDLRAALRRAVHFALVPMKHLITTRANTVDTLHAKTPMLSYKPLHTDFFSIAWARIQDYLAIARARIAAIDPLFQKEPTP
jgi:hypothetical protein